jgi:LPXTG-motif cell wall-anchored protein
MQKIKAATRVHSRSSINTQGNHTKERNVMELIIIGAVVLALAAFITIRRKNKTTNTNSTGGGSSKNTDSNTHLK